MSLLWGMVDGDRQQAHRARVASPVQPVEPSIGTRRREQRADGGLVARVQAVLRDHGRHGAPSPWRLSSGIDSESSREGGRQ